MLLKNKDYIDVVKERENTSMKYSIVDSIGNTSVSLGILLWCGNLLGIKTALGFSTFNLGAGLIIGSFFLNPVSAGFRQELKNCDKKIKIFEETTISECYKENYDLNEI